MRRLLLIGALAFTVCGLGLTAEASPSTSSAGMATQVTERVTFRDPAPSCAQAIRDLGLEGQPVSCEEPAPPTHDAPQMHGRYRLFPESYVGPLTYEDSPDTAPAGMVSDDLKTIKASSMYKEPAWLPDGYALSSINTNDSDSEHVIAATYTGPGEPIEIDDVRRSEWPIDVIEPAGDSPTVWEAPALAGVPAVLSYPKPGSPPWVDGTTLQFVQGDVETTVVGRHLDPQTATQIALSLICGASCASPPAADGKTAEGGLSAASPQPAAAPQRADVSPPDTGTLATMGTAFPTEHRVIAGLGSTAVQALHWDPPEGPYWHGSTYDEKALDLRLLNDSDGSITAHKPVYVATWAWGGGALHFYTWNYSQTTQCTGRYVDLKDSNGTTVGRLTYVHLESMPDPSDSWPSNATGWTIRYVGNVAGEQPNCDWHGAHLHQGQTASLTAVHNNTAIPDSQGRINPTNPEPPAYNWMFRVLYTAPEDWDGDGCTGSKEAAMGFNPNNYWDFYDVPVPARPDPTPSGGKSRAVTMGDVFAVLFYVGAYSGDAGSPRPHPNGVRYDSIKDGDWNGDTVTNVYDKVGLRYDRSYGGAPDPPWNAGPPDGAVNIGDVLVALNQVGLDCTGPPPSSPPEGASAGGGGTLLSGPNAMAVDAIPGGGVDPVRWWMGGSPFDMDVVVSAAAASYVGYDLALTYDDQILQFVPTADLGGDTVLESWAYSGLGGMSLNATVTSVDAGGDTALDHETGGSGRSSGTTTATGAVITARFRCVGNGTSAVHLVTPSESGTGTTTLGVGGATIETSLADASVSCFGVQ